MSAARTVKTLALRRVRQEDAAALAGIYAPFVRDTAVTFEYDAPDAEEFARRIAETSPTYPYLAAEADGRVIAYAYAHRFAVRAAYGWSAETSIYVDPAYCGCGVGRALYGALLQLLTMQRVQTAYAILALPNPASAGLQEAFGFTLSGSYHRVGYKHGRWLDTAVYEKPLGTYAVPPTPMLPFASLDPAAVDAVLRQYSLL